MDTTTGDHHLLLMGLDGMCRAHTLDYFADGHRGAALVAAWFFCHEAPLEPGVADVLRGWVTRQWGGLPLFEPFPAEEVSAGGTQRILATLEAHASGLRQAGHNLIFPALALRAFGELPRALTPRRLHGICALIGRFAAVDEDVDTACDRVVIPPGNRDLAAWLMAEYIRAGESFDGRGQGWTGHLLTIGRALLDLRELGFARTAGFCEDGLACYIRRLHRGPQPTDAIRDEHPVTALRPHQRAYWEARAQGNLALGHVIKYPYGFYGLLDRAADPVLQRRCLDAAYRIF